MPPDTGPLPAHVLCPAVPVPVPPQESAEHAWSLPDSNEPIQCAGVGVGGAGAGQWALRTLGGAGGVGDFKPRGGAAGHSLRPPGRGPGKSRWCSQIPLRARFLLPWLPRPAGGRVNLLPLGRGLPGAWVEARSERR